MQTTFSTGRRDTAPPGYLGGRQHMTFICPLAILIRWPEGVPTVSVVHYHTSGLPSSTIRFLTGIVTVPLCGHLWLPWLECTAGQNWFSGETSVIRYLKAHLPGSWHWPVCSIQHCPLSSLKLFIISLQSIYHFFTSQLLFKIQGTRTQHSSTDQIPPAL